VTDSSDGTIYSVDGFVFFDILTEALAQAASETVVAMARCHTSVRPEEQKRLLLGALGDKATSLFVFDPGERSRIQSFLPSGYRIIVAPHNVDVPVGIGFSLPCLPQLLRSKLWHLILDEAIRVYGPHDQPLENLGIRLSI